MAMREDRDVDSLLAQGRVSGPERERIFAAVSARVAPRRAWSARLWLAGLVTLAGAAAAVLLLARPATDAGFGVKGGASGGGAALDVVCAGASLEACPIGATLIFAVHGAAQPGFLAAFAEPLAPGAARIVYFSSETEAPALAAADGTQPFSRGIRVGPEHAPGAYRVHLYLTRSPASRAALAAGLPAAELVASRVVPLAIVAQ